MRKKFQLPRPGTTLTCRPASTPVTHNEACMKLRRLHPRVGGHHVRHCRRPRPRSPRMDRLAPTPLSRSPRRLADVVSALGGLGNRCGTWLHCPPTCIGRRRPSCGFPRRGRAPAPASPHSPPPRHLNLCDDMPRTAAVASVSTSETPLQRRNTLGEKPSVFRAGTSSERGRGGGRRARPRQRACQRSPSR